MSELPWPVVLQRLSCLIHHTHAFSFQSQPFKHRCWLYKRISTILHRLVDHVFAHLPEESSMCRLFVASYFQYEELEINRAQCTNTAFMRAMWERYARFHCTYERKKASIKLCDYHKHTTAEERKVCEEHRAACKKAWGVFKAASTQPQEWQYMIQPIVNWVLLRAGWRIWHSDKHGWRQLLFYFETVSHHQRVITVVYELVNERDHWIRKMNWVLKIPLMPWPNI